MTRIDTSVSASYRGEDVDDGGDVLSVPLRLRFGGGVTNDGIGFQVFPAVSAQLFATNGDITFGPTRTVADINDLATLRGTDEADTRHPVTALNSATSLGAALSLEGKAISASLSHDPDLYALKASQSMYGAFRVNYDTTYRQCYWKHNGERHGDLFYKGLILAIYKGSTAVLEFNDGNDNNGPLDKTEIYRVTSKYLVDHQGAWEYPPGWPTDPNYPNTSITETPDRSSFTVLERAHFIGYVNRRGAQTWDEFHIYIEQPYTNLNSYRPQYELTLNTNPPKGFEDVFADINYGEIEARMRDQFPNLVVQ